MGRSRAQLSRDYLPEHEASAETWRAPSAKYSNCRVEESPVAFMQINAFRMEL